MTIRGGPIRTFHGNTVALVGTLLALRGLEACIRIEECLT